MVDDERADFRGERRVNLRGRKLQSVGNNRAIMVIGACHVHIMDGSAIAMYVCEYPQFPVYLFIIE